MMQPVLKKLLLILSWILTKKENRASQVVDLTHLESESLPVNSILLAN
jgi:hypothetical protein